MKHATRPGCHPEERPPAAAATKDLPVFIVCLALVLVMACHGRRRAWGPEDLIFNSGTNAPQFVETTVNGFVTCATCAPETSPMVVDVWSVTTPLLEPVASGMFTRAGAYELTIKAPYAETLRVTATIFADGGTRVVSQEFQTTDDTSRVTDAVTVNLRTD